MKTQVRESASAAPATAQAWYVIRLRACREQPERIGNYLTRLPLGNTGSRAVSPFAALRFPSIQAAEAGLAEHLAGLPDEKWDAVYEIAPLAEEARS